MADKTINELTAASTMTDDDLLVLQQNGVAKKLSGKSLGSYVSSAAEAKVNELNTAIDNKISEVQQAINDAETDINSIVTAVQNMTELGTDTTLTTSGMAADAKATGNNINDLKSAINVLEDNTKTPLLYGYNPNYYIKWDTGGLSSKSSMYSYTGYIYVGDCNYIRFKNYKTPAAAPAGGMAFYSDNSGTYVSGIPAKGDAESYGYTDYVLIEVPATAKYARFSLLSDTDTYGPHPEIYCFKNEDTLDEELKRMVFRYDLSENYAPPFSESNMIAATSGKWSSNNSYPYMYAERRYHPISDENPLMVTLNDPDTKIRCFYYSDASESSFILNETYPGDALTILNGRIQGNACSYVRFQIYRSDNTHSTSIFDTLVSKFKVFTTNTKYRSTFSDSQIFFITKINATEQYDSADVDSVSEKEVDSVIAFPNTYNSGGDPVPLVYLHHGSSAKIDSVSATWCSQYAHWRDTLIAGLLDAGYAVFDVNGYGSAADGEQNDYGCPLALQAFIKAYDYITTHFNVQKLVNVAGYSMGGANACAIAKTYPELTKTLSLISPSVLNLSAIKDTSKNGVAIAYGYSDATEMEADDYSNLQTSIIGIECYDQSGLRIFPDINYDWITNSNNYRILIKDIFCPVKTWVGDADTVVNVDSGLAIKEAMNNANKQAYYRKISGDHAIGAGGNSVVNSELIMWLDRFNK